MIAYSVPVENDIGGSYVYTFNSAVSHSNDNILVENLIGNTFLNAHDEAGGNSADNHEVGETITGGANHSVDQFSSSGSGIQIEYGNGNSNYDEFQLDHNQMNYSIGSSSFYYTEYGETTPFGINFYAQFIGGTNDYFTGGISGYDLGDNEIEQGNSENIAHDINSYFAYQEFFGSDGTTTYSQAHYEENGDTDIFGFVNYSGVNVSKNTVNQTHSNTNTQDDFDTSTFISGSGNQYHIQTTAETEVTLTGNVTVFSTFDSVVPTGTYIGTTPTITYVTLNTEIESYSTSTTTYIATTLQTYNYTFTFSDFENSFTGIEISTRDYDIIYIPGNITYQTVLFPQVDAEKDDWLWVLLPNPNEFGVTDGPFDFTDLFISTNGPITVVQPHLIYGETIIPKLDDSEAWYNTTASTIPNFIQTFYGQAASYSTSEETQTFITLTYSTGTTTDFYRTDSSYNYVLPMSQSTREYLYQLTTTYSNVVLVTTDIGFGTLSYEAYDQTTFVGGLEYQSSTSMTALLITWFGSDLGFNSLTVPRITYITGVTTAITEGPAPFPFFTHVLATESGTYIPLDNSADPNHVVGFSQNNFAGGTTSDAGETDYGVSAARAATTVVNPLQPTGFSSRFNQVGFQMASNISATDNVYPGLGIGRSIYYPVYFYQGCFALPYNIVCPFNGPEFGATEFVTGDTTWKYGWDSESGISITTTDGFTSESWQDRFIPMGGALSPVLMINNFNTQYGPAHIGGHPNITADNSQTVYLSGTYVIYDNSGNTAIYEFTGDNTSMVMGQDGISAISGRSGIDISYDLAGFPPGQFGGGFYDYKVLRQHS